MEQNLQILLLEDSLDDAALMERMLKKEQISFTSALVETREEYKKSLQDFRPDVVISDHSLPQFDSEEALQMFKEYKEKINPSAVFILVTGTVSEEFAVQIMKKGADDYILKDRLTRLPTAILSALEKAAIEENRRRVEEEKLHLLDILEKSLHEIYVFSSGNYRFEYVNEEALNNLGYSLEKMKLFSPMDLLQEFDEGNFRHMLSSVEKSKRGKIFERNAIRKDGSIYPVQVHLQLVVHGSQKKYLANVLDISDLKSQEQQKELAMFIQSTFNTNRSLKESLRIILEEFCRLSEKTAAQIWMKNFEDQDLQYISEYCNKNKPLNAEAGFLVEKVKKEKHPVYCKDLQEELKSNGGQQLNDYKSAMAYPFFIGEEIMAVVNLFSEGTAEETSFLKLTEGVRDQLTNNIKRKKTEEELSKVFELSPDVLAVTSTDGYFKKLNPSLSKILGFSTEELLSTPINKFLHPDDVPSREKRVELHKEEGEVMTYQNRYLTKNGTYKWMSWSVTSFLEEGLAFAVGKDITEQRDHIQAIEMQNKKLAEIAWEQSHVVRAPLARMMGCIDYIEGDGDNWKRLLGNVKTSAYELDEIIRTIVNKAEKIKSI